jgi:hypothetical protein
MGAATSGRLELTSRGGLVDSHWRRHAHTLLEVLANIEKHITKCIAHVLRRCQKLHVIPARDQMQVIVLDRVLHQPKVSPLTPCGKRHAYRLHRG